MYHPAYCHADNKNNDNDEDFINDRLYFGVCQNPVDADPQAAGNNRGKDWDVNRLDNQVINNGLGFFSKRFNDCPDNILGQIGKQEGENNNAAGNQPLRHWVRRFKKIKHFSPLQKKNVSRKEGVFPLMNFLVPIAMI
jgi:hypothetical protein